MIIVDVRGVNDEFLRRAADDPNLVFGISPRQFEELVAELLSRLGYRIELTPQTRDGGKDIYAAKHDNIGNFLYIVECKRYPIDASGQRLIFTTPVIEHFVKHRQVRWWHREAGGQLFARFDLPDVIIEEATGPRRTDWRTRHGYRPNRRAEQKEISIRHRRGLHFIGDWHTHPEPIPSPSEQDEVSMQDMFSRSDHSLNGFVLAIVGIELPPRGLHISVVGRSSRLVLKGQNDAKGSQTLAAGELPNLLAAGYWPLYPQKGPHSDPKRTTEDATATERSTRSCRK